MSRDLITGLVCLAGSLVLLALTYNLPGPSLLVPIGPGFYPRIILGITALLAAALVVQAWRARRRAQPAGATGATQGPNYALVLTSFAVFGVYVGVLPLIGYRLATFAFVLALQPLLERPRNAKGWAIAVAVALITAIATFHLFQDYLSVLLPRGRWTGF
ncbi:MAG TPA: tripartite tricarboxylate transporter TctB family protein [Burkholderiales bacterium]|nr:tripartite tricarboxylate transporter TctB family protein [Burkholderiales bacterium]